jgi:Protein of unknown function (DUF4058)
MPSPFPGMDPFIEGADWTSFHTEFVVEMARQLSPKLRPKYFARAEKRFVLTTFTDWPAGDAVSRPMIPDVSVVKVHEGQPASSSEASIPAPIRMTTIIPERVPHVSLEIDEIDGRRLVTAIELLSPTNKRSDGRSDYLERRHSLLTGRTHLMEIDLVRSGERVPMRQPLPSVPYFVFLTRVESRPSTEVWPIPLRSPLPKVPVPLLPGDPDVTLDLQAAFTSVYDSFGYESFVNYHRELKLPLPPEDWEWVLSRLTDAGKR